MLTTKQVLAAGVFASVVCATPAQAQTGDSPTTWVGGRMDRSLYLGASLGQTRFNAACDGSPLTCGNKDTAYKVFAGYQLNRNFAAEGGYYNLGDASTVTVAGRSSFKVLGWELVAVGLYPVMPQLSVYAKGGIIRSRVSLSSNFGIAGSDHSWDVTFGAGAQYALTPSASVRLEWQRYDDVGGSNTGRDDVNLVSGTLLFRF